MSIAPWFPIVPTVTNGPDARSEFNLCAVLAARRVTTDDRYKRTPTDTFCNIFVCDCALAMQVVLPHWAMPDGTPAKPGAPGAGELSANALSEWIEGKAGRAAGWVECSRQKAQEAANNGLPVVALWKNPAGKGHAAWVRPGEWRLDGPWMIQAGARNFEQATMRECFGMHAPRFFKNA